jgi:processing peptidase subunit alpha
MKLFGQIVRFPLFLEEEIESAKESTMYELQDSRFKPEVFLPEMVHSIAFSETKIKENKFGLANNNADVANVNTLGYSQKIHESLLQGMCQEKLLEFRNQWVTPNRVAICAVGVEHDHLVEIADKYFGDWSGPSEELLANQRKLTQPARYTGGTLIYDTSGMPASPNPDDMTLTHLQICFESFGSTDPDIYSLATLGSLLGGGGSFSAGGPGKVASILI